MLLLNYGTYKYLYKREYIVRSNGYKLKICSEIRTHRGSNISRVYCENLFCFPILRLIYRKSGNRKIQVEYQINQHYTYMNALNSNYLMEHEVYLCTCQYVSALEKYIFVTHVFSFFRQSVQRLKSINAYNNQSTFENIHIYTPHIAQVTSFSFIICENAFMGIYGQHRNQMSQTYYK